ncbi:MAG: DNA-binding protein [Sulfuricurvum sp.]|jgi:metal-responsive CopG/Arc/MetJ family transcriptional regulator|uniref:DNA-binding protein n=1 Tax=Sulfuricurvum sp. TaxID=2025608 RepID=UPI0025E314F2|nr:DNA-binding protein [Sulfuricurvum sp.]MCK9373979.1 DNA-binding protein [Sulfuricurvum sp.]
MHTITLKSDDTFYETLNDMVKALKITKSELIRRSVTYYQEALKQEQLKEQMKRASLKVRDHSLSMVQEFDDTLNDGLV